MPTTGDGATQVTDGHRLVLSAQHLTRDEFYRRLIEALRVLAFGTAAERESFFGEKVSVNIRDRRESVRLLLRYGP